METTNRFRAVIFDLDGTLLDTLQDLTNAVNRTMEAFHFPQFDRKQIRMFVGHGARHLFECTLPKGVDAQTEKKCYALFLENYPAQSGETTAPYPGICDVLAALRTDGIGVAVVSNKPDAATHIVCKHFFGDLVPYAAGDDGVHPCKPAPDNLYRIMEQMGVSREECIYVGDSDTDIQTARNAGIPCVNVTWGYRTREEIAAAGGILFANTAQELVDILKKDADQIKKMFETA